MQIRFINNKLLSKMFFLISSFQVTLFLLVKFSILWAYPSGPPLSTCEFMTPHHPENKPQTTVAPYNITVSKSSYTAGENLTVTISGTKTFKGFILQAQGTNSPVAWPVGVFNEIPDGMYSRLFPLVVTQHLSSERDNLRT